MEIHNSETALFDLYRKLEAAEGQITNGTPLIDGDEAFRRCRMKHDLKISELQDHLRMTMDARESLTAMREQYNL